MCVSVFYAFTDRASTIPIAIFNIGVPTVVLGTHIHQIQQGHFFLSRNSRTVIVFIKKFGRI